MINPENLDLSSLPSVPLTARKKLPQTPSIYFAIDSQGTIQYIGRSINPRNRWVNHHRANQLEDNCRIAWLDCDESLLNEVEEALISFFNPPLNGVFYSRQTDKEQVYRPMKISFEKDFPNIGERIKEARQKSKKTLTELAYEAGISVNHWVRIEREGVKVLPVDVVRNIEKALKVNLGVTFND